MWTMKWDQLLEVFGQTNCSQTPSFKFYLLHTVLPKEIFRFSKKSHLPRSRIYFTSTSRADNYVAWKALFTEFCTMNIPIFLFVENKNPDWIGNCKINRIQVWYFRNQAWKSEINYLFQKMLRNIWTSCNFSTRQLLKL